MKFRDKLVPGRGPGRAAFTTLRATFVALMVGILVALGAIAPVAAVTRVPKVVLIVGPVGSVTPRYRALANDAAAVARKNGAQVVKVYSPNATWPRVRKALDGASVVVYLGHGNGWPSRYRDELYPPSQNGFGLNPVAGVDDYAHQYFGEAWLDDVPLAPNAVVLLHHLCYASGNSEPGLPEGTVAQAVARVDNYAAGFLRAGARAVVAEAHMGPAWYVRQLLTTRRSIEQIWGRSPEAHGNTFAVGSKRTPGYTARLDPDRRSSGFFRSLVSRGVTAGELRSGATGTRSAAVVAPPAEPSLAGRSLRFDELRVATLPIATTKTTVTLPLAGGSVDAIPTGAQVGLRWDPVLLDAPLDPAPLAAADLAADPGASPAPSPSAAADPAADPGAFSSPSPGPAAEPAAVDSPELVVPSEAPAVDLVVPERVGSVVDLAPVKRGAKGLSVAAAFPDAPGLYRLVPTLHTPTGEAYDAATQALLTPVLVRVAGPIAVAYGAPASLVLRAGMPAEVAIRVLDTGSRPWEQEVGGIVGRLPARLVATWVTVDAVPLPPPASALLSPEELRTPAGDVVQLAIEAPAVPGEYLLLVDVVSPLHGPLSALGSAPAIVPVTVAAADVPDVSPSPVPEAADGP